MPVEIWTAIIASASALLGVVVGQVAGAFGRRRAATRELRQKFARVALSAIRTHAQNPTRERVPLLLPDPPATLMLEQPVATAMLGTWLESVAEQIRLGQLAQKETLQDTWASVRAVVVLGAWARQSVWWPAWRMAIASGWANAMATRAERRLRREDARAVRRP